jgi:hypothetical protein
MLTGMHDRTAELGASLHGMYERGDFHEVRPRAADIKHFLHRYSTNAVGLKPSSS